MEQIAILWIHHHSQHDVPDPANHQERADCQPGLHRPPPLHHRDASLPSGLHTGLQILASPG